MPGLRLYAGAPGMGKTWLAIQHLSALEARDHRPSIVIDSSSTSTLAHVHLVRSAREALDRMVDGASSRLIPSGVEEVHLVFDGARAVGRCHVLLDEMNHWLSSRSGHRDPIIKACRVYRHSELDVLLTTQHLSGDVPGALMSCCPELLVFRQFAPSALERLREHGVDPDQARALRKGEYLRVRP